MTTTILFKTDKKLKAAAQKAVKKMGIPLSTLLNNAMRDAVLRQEVTFSTGEKPLIPTPYLRRILEQGEKDLKAGKVNYYNSLEEMRAALDK